MTSITKYIRAAVVERAVDLKFADARTALKVAKVAFADALYMNKYGKDLPLVLHLPKEWVTQVVSVGVRGPFWSWNCRADKSGVLMTDEIRLSKPMPSPSSQPALYCSPANKDLKESEDHPLWPQAQALHKQHVKLLNDIEELSEKVRAVMATVNTYKQMEKAWPDGMLFLPTEKPKYALVVSPDVVKSLNKTLGLPPK